MLPELFTGLGLELIFKFFKKGIALGRFPLKNELLLAKIVNEVMPIKLMVPKIKNIFLFFIF